jgi:hypothetical protein
MAQTVANIQIEPCTVTWNSVELGYTEGDIQISLEESLVPITSHQTGTDELGAFRTGKSVSVTVTLKETTRAALEGIFVAQGNTLTPAAGTEVSGWGTDKQFTSNISTLAALVLHPIAKGATLTEDYNFHKAYPMLESITLSAENATTVSVTFKVYRDDSKDSKISFFCKGDGTQDLT